MAPAFSALTTISACSPPAFLVTRHPLNSAGTFRLSGPNQNVFDDAASDNVLGGTGRDYLILGSGDGSDLAKNEV